MAQSSEGTAASPSESRNSSSTGLADVFRSLSASRSKPTISGSAASGAISSPARQPSYADSNELLLDLKTGRLPASRVAAAEEAAKDMDLINSFYLPSSGDISQLWDAGKDMIEKDAPPQMRKAGFNLLIACSKRSNLSEGQRESLFAAIIEAHHPDNFDRQLDALMALTRESCDIGNLQDAILPVLTNWLDTCFVAVTEFRAQRKKDKGSKSTSTQDPQIFLDRLLGFIKKVLEGGFMFSQDDLQEIVLQLTGLCKKTSNTGDIQASILIFLVVLKNFKFPISTLPACMEVLCGTFRSVKSLQSMTWDVVMQFLMSDVSQQCVEILLGILTFSPKQPVQTLNSACGAVLILGDVYHINGKDGLALVPFSRFVNALNIVLARKHPRLDGDVLNTICSLFDNPEVVELTLSEDWTHLFDVLNTRKVLVNTAESDYDEKKSESSAPTMEQGLRRMITLLEELWNRLSVPQKNIVVKYFVSVKPYLGEEPCRLLVNFYHEEQMCYPIHSDWMVKRQDLIKTFILDPDQTNFIRLLALKTVREAFFADMEPGVTDKYTPETIVESISDEQNISMLEAMLDFAVDTLDANSSDIAFDIVHEQIRKRARNSNAPATGCSQAPSTVVPELSAAAIATKALVKIFLRSLNNSAHRAQGSFHSLLEISGSENCQSDARLTAFKLLFRLRSDENFAIRVIPSLEDECPTSILLKTFYVVQNDEALSNKRQSGSEDSIPSRIGRNSPVNQPLPASRIKRSSSSAPKPFTRTPPNWMYGGFKGLPEDPPTTSSRVVCSKLPTHHLHHSIPATCSNPGQPPGKGILQVKLWVETLISYLQSGEDWELYSYIIVHLSSQLTNTPLFENCMLQIQLLRSVICEQLKASSFHEPPQMTGLKKADVAICLLNTLTVLLIYRNHFSQHEEDEMVRTFMLGIGSWDGTSRSCIHFLSLCCHEIPLSVTKSLKAILLKMAQIITQRRVAMHILEFLGNLARLPEIYKNLQDEELRIVFGICIKFLEHSREQRQGRQTSPPTRPSQSAGRQSGTARDFLLPSDGSDDLPQYVYAFAYHVMTFWFLSFKLQDRAKHVSWIAKSLVWKDSQGKELIEEQSQVLLDMMQRTAYSDLGETRFAANFSELSDGPILAKSWLVGLSVVTIHTASTSGLTQVTKRQASGTTHFLYYQHTAQLPPHHIRPPAEARPATEGVPDRASIFPSHILLQLCGSVAALTPNMQPVPLPDDDVTRRAISSFDRNNTVDGHKIGVVYVADGQSSETEILGNTTGTAEYEHFVAGLGTMVQLQDATFNTQGLDKDQNMDGEFTFAWRDRVTEIIFHIATMMPTDLEHDPQCINKKRHLGNDFVNIIYNDSNAPFKFDTLPSAFNYVNIVITPSSQIALHDGPKPFVVTSGPLTPFYKIQVLLKLGFPEISPAAEPKFISAKNLSTYVRFLALNASVFSLVWANRVDGAEYISSWQNRLREIKKLKERVQAAAAKEARTASAASASVGTQRRVSYMPMTDGSSHRLSAIETNTLGQLDAEGLVEEYDFSKWT
ncbi:MAG: Tuberous sclerosis 2-like protein [Cirrosporium novae-zelandiae]|nr:MAG: Tuberous sclerosis 2-like protein [Cirrosporium novae-zelandiae]